MDTSHKSNEAQPDLIAKLTELYRSGQFELSLRAAREACKSSPDHPAAWNIRGASARALGKSNEAELSFTRLEALQPAFAGAPYNLALVYEDAGRTKDATMAYGRALACDPDLAQAHNNLGILLNRVGEYATALEHLAKASELRPDMPEIHNSLGNALRNLERKSEAKAAYQKALAIRPEFPSALYNLGVIEQERGNAQAAIAAYSKALQLDPENAIARAALLHQYSLVCNWEAMEPLLDRVAELGITTAPVLPFPMLALEDNQERQSIRARRWSQARYGQFQSIASPVPPAARPKRLKLGYYSACFRNHPTVQLISGVLRAHDRERFETHAISCGPDRGDRSRAQVQGLADQFHDVRTLPDAQIADRIRELGIDLLVDLDGYTTDNRSAPLAMRPCGVQINMLGYPGSLGSPAHDYIVCDPIVAPKSAAPHYSERMLQLPGSYQSNDNTIEISSNAGARRDHGLPEQGLVLACFNSGWKITPREFAIWMRVLDKVPGSVLWLLRSGALGESNLRHAAESHGIDPARLVFAQRLPLAQHLARHSHADLVVDTFSYGAHTTASDALWAGQPLVTKLGEQFCARVGASLLNAVGLGDLVTQSDTEYEELILRLLRDPELLSEFKGRLRCDRSKLPLFDTDAYTRHLETGFDAAYGRWLAGELPQDIVVTA